MKEKREAIGGRCIRLMNKCIQVFLWLNYYLNSFVSKWTNSVEWALSLQNLVLLLHNISTLPFHSFPRLHEQYCLAQTCFSTLVSSVHSIDRRVLEIRLCGNVICWQIISRLVPVNPTRNESQEPFQHSYPRYGTNNYFEIVVKQRVICSHITLLTPTPLIST